jgi:hypothetical protein
MNLQPPRLNSLDAAELQELHRFLLALRNAIRDLDERLHALESRSES